MSERTFLDTNVLVYAFDDDENEKQVRAREILRDAGRDAGYVLSSQVLGEFYVVVTRKLARPLAPADAELAVRSLAELPVTPVDRHTVLAAVARSRAHSLSLWDALIVQSAIESSCGRLLTEDLQDGREFDGVRIENPFRA